MELHIIKKNILLNQIPVSAEICYYHDRLRIEYMIDSKDLNILTENFNKNIFKKIFIDIQSDKVLLHLPLIGAGYTGTEDGIHYTLDFDVPFNEVKNAFPGLKNQKIHVIDEDRAEFVEVDDV